MESNTFSALKMMISLSSLIKLKFTNFRCESDMLLDKRRLRMQILNR